MHLKRSSNGFQIGGREGATVFFIFLKNKPSWGNFLILLKGYVNNNCLHKGFKNVKKNKIKTTIKWIKTLATLHAPRDWV